MSPQKHLAVGIVGGAAIMAVTHDANLSWGFFLGSWAIDLDHVWQYWRMNNFKEPLNVKRFFEFNDVKTEQFRQKPWLHVLFMHTLEFFVLLLALAHYLPNPFVATVVLGALFGAMLHFMLDDWYLCGVSPHSFTKRTHSLIEYYLRRFIGKEKEYKDIYPS